MVYSYGKLEKSGERHRHLRPEQHRGPFPQLPARSDLYDGHGGGVRRLWRGDEHLCLGGPGAGAADLRHGDRFFPLRQQERRGTHAGVFYHLAGRGCRCGGLPGVGVGLPALRGRMVGLRGTSVVRGHDDGGRGDGRRAEYPLRLPALPAASAEVRGPQAALHLPEHRA